MVYRHLVRWTYSTPEGDRQIHYAVEARSPREAIELVRGPNICAPGLVERIGRVATNPGVGETWPEYD